MAHLATDLEFPCTLVISIGLPTHRLASSALRALQVDAELSPLVRRSFSLVNPHSPASSTAVNGHTNSSSISAASTSRDTDDIDVTQTVLRTKYEATTNRMLRVAVNGFMESLGVILEVMQELDVDVLVEEALGAGEE
ncbi:hypothetical protein MMC24_003011 [Lignoscripta atroalba]|nr:hypothetical protein [Lignoscripta atroalba]